MISRRALLLSAPAAAIASACRHQPYRSADFLLPQRSVVGLFAAANYSVDLVDVISRGLQVLNVNVKGLRVLLKPNLVEYEAGTVTNTHVNVVGAAAHAILSAGAREVIVAGGPGHRRDLEYLLVSTGLYDHLKDLKIRFVDLNHDDVRAVPLRSRFTKLQEIMLPTELLQADFIVSMPKLKTHHGAVMTASMKNLFGVVPGAVYGWPKNLFHFRGIDNSIIDLAATIRPQLAIVDGIVGMEGDGPVMGTPRVLGVIAIGTDPVAVDATCARLIGLDPSRIKYLSTATCRRPRSFSDTLTAIASNTAARASIAIDRILRCWICTRIAGTRASPIHAANNDPCKGASKGVAARIATCARSETSCFVLGGENCELRAVGDATLLENSGQVIFDGLFAD